MITYKWEVLSLYTKPSLDGLTDVVRRVTWRYQITDGGNYGEIYQDTYLPDPTDSNTYIAYSDLSEETILGWVQSIEDIPALQAELQLKLEKSKNPDIVENKFPWILEDRYNPREDLFVMVYNDEAVYGPVHWHSDGMNASLEMCGHPRSMPEDILAFRKGIVPYDEPLIVSSTLRIYKAQIVNEQPPHNPFYDNGHIVWDFSNDIAVGTYQSIEKPFYHGKDFVKGMINNWVNYTMKDVPIPMTINGQDMVFNNQVLDKLELSVKCNHMDDTSTCDWKSSDGKWFTATKADLAAILTALNDRTSFLATWEKEKTTLLEQISSLSEVINMYESLNIEVVDWINSNSPIPLPMAPNQ